MKRYYAVLLRYGEDEESTGWAVMDDKGRFIKQYAQDDSIWDAMYLQHALNKGGPSKERALRRLGND